ncbi:SDR family oxidoreductase [Listeria aquatica]|uniref:SDR family oxidoreductase n=1 Tax=Listeria aquatica TaxID=1494960 RepID=A0A841ZQ55_9LIST|nr:SDR family oxidoreductase [Listeria aquatica]MBC1521468.1 SDR family oxidoreductase [Listeria aquatica]
MESIQDKVIIITGASSGIGMESARLLVANGAKVMLFARREEKLQQLTKELGEENCGYVTGDVRLPSQVEKLVQETIRRFEKIDVLFANAGIMPASSISDLKLDEWNEMININIKGVLNCIASVLPKFIAQKSGHVVVTSSIAGKKIFPGNSVYCGTKFAVKAIVEGLRQESIAERTNIKTTLLYPGAIQTELLETISSKDDRANWDRFYQIAISPKSVAESVLYALSQPKDVGVNEITILPAKQS